MLVAVCLYKIVNVCWGGGCELVYARLWGLGVSTHVASVGYTSWDEVVGMFMSSRMRLTSKRAHIVCTCVPRGQCT